MSEPQGLSNPEKRALLFLRSDLALQDRILKISKESAENAIQSYNARSDLKNKSARFSGNRTAFRDGDTC